MPKITKLKNEEMKSESFVFLKPKPAIKESVTNEDVTTPQLKGISQHKPLYYEESSNEESLSLGATPMKNNDFYIKNTKIRSVQPGMVYVSPQAGVEQQKDKKSLKCGVCSTAIDRDNFSLNYYNKESSLEFGNSEFICEKCFRENKMNKCQFCQKLFENSLEDGFCIYCINNAITTSKVLKSYTHRVENYAKEQLKKAKGKFNSKIANEIFEEFDPSAFSVTAGGVFKKLFGIELEYETKSANYGLTLLQVSRLLSEERNKEGGLQAEIKKDATLKDGFEVVSAPGDKHYHRDVWGSFFDYINKRSDIVCTPYNFDPQTMERGTGCGCHIHISKDAFLYYNDYEIKDSNNKTRIIQSQNGQGLALVKLTTFIHHPFNRKFIEIISGRPSGMHFDYLKIKGAQFNGNKIITKNGGVKTCLHLEPGAGHRTAINFETSTHKTLEFRFFNATKDLNTLLTYLDFVDALCSFCQPCNSSIINMKDWHNFYDFVIKNSYDYKYLYQFFTKNQDFVKYYYTPTEEIEKVKPQVKIENKESQQELKSRLKQKYTVNTINKKSYTDLDW